MDPSDAPAAAAGLPPYTGANLPFPGLDENGDPPLVRLVKKLYAAPAESAATPTFNGALDLFPFAHDCAILREPFSLDGGHGTRACLMGDSCVGHNPLLPGHDDCGGVTLMEIMSPAELSAFYATGELPPNRRTCLLCARYNVHAAYLFARKRRTFPQNALLNHWVNAAGDGEYSSEFLIPSANDSTWAGVVGTVTGLYLNALRLVQCADKSWRVDQSALQHVTRVSCNVTFPSLYRGLIAPPHAFLRAFYTHRARVADAPVLFFTHEELVEARPKLGHPPTTEYMAWPAGAIKSFMHRLLFYRVNRLNQMLDELEQLYGKLWSYNMQLYIDAHVGMALLVERGETLSTWTLKYTAHEHALPDLSALCVQAAVNSVVAEGLSVTDRKRELARPRAVAAQLLIRALPEFSQTRWLHALFIRCLHDRELSSTMFALAQAALLGNYARFAGARMPFATRKAFLDGFTQATAPKIFAAMPANEHLVLYIMGTYMLTILPLCPALEDLVVAMSPFQSQANRIFDALAAVRSAARADWRLMFSTDVLESLKKSHKRMPKRKLVPRGLSDCSGALVLSAQRTAARRGLKRRGVAYDPAAFDEHVKRVRRGEPPPAALAAAARAAAGQVLSAMEADPSRAAVVIFDRYCIGDDDLRRLADYAAAADFAHQLRLTPLPADFVGSQVAAVARRFGCAPGDWATLRRSTRACVCAACGLRNFCLTRQERNGASRRMDNIRAAGYRKLALDMAKGDMRCVATDTCAAVPLVETDVATPDAAGGAAGGVLVLRNVAVMLSPCCGHLCATSSMRVVPTGIDCPACTTARREEADATPDPRICAHCGKRSQLRQAMEQTVLLRDAQGRIIKYGFCRSHMRSWARTQSGYISYDFLSRNMVNRSGNGLVLNPT